jgi:gliding motility-associated-like protein
MIKTCFIPFICTLLLICTIHTQAQYRNLLFSGTNRNTQLHFSGATASTSYVPGPNKGAIGHAEDSSGNILFYVSEYQIYRYNTNTVMPGSAGMNIYSASAEIAICPNPANANQYYVFYTVKPCDRLLYCIVDMSLDGGQGDVIMLNTPVDPSVPSYYAEGVEVIKVPCENRYWLVAYACSKGFVRFTIDNTGISSRQLIYSYPIGGSGTGELDYYNGRLGLCFGGSKEVLFGTFDPNTGVFANPTSLNLTSTSVHGVYGLEFSPDAGKAYISLAYESAVDNLYQYDFNSGAVHSFFLPPSNPAPQWNKPGPGQIEMGPDGNLYIAYLLGNMVYVVKNASSFTPLITSIPTTAVGDLSVSDPFQSDEFLEADFFVSAMCLNDPAYFTCIRNSCQAATYSWDFGDPASGMYNTSTWQNPNHIYTSAGTYVVSVIVNGGTPEADTITHPLVIGEHQLFELGNDTSICNGNSLTLNGPLFPGVLYNWSNHDTTRNTSVNTAGTFVLTISDANCISRDSITISLLPNKIPYLATANTYLCPGATTTLYANNLTTAIAWSTGTTGTNTLTVNAPGIYWAEITDIGCTTRDSIEILDANTLLHCLGNDTTICPGQLANYSFSVPGSTLIFDNGPSNTSGNFTGGIKPGTHTIEIHLASCIIRDTVLIKQLINPTLDIGPDLSNCEGSTVTLTAPPISTGTFNWSTGETSQSIQVNHTSTIGLTWNTGCGTLTDLVKVLFHEYPESQLPEEVFACLPVNTILDAGASYSGYTWSTGEYTHQIQANHLGSYSVILNNHGCKSYDTVTVKQLLFEDYETLPNIITPNNDTRNDHLFFSKYSSCKSFHIALYDRWGIQIAESSDPVNCWDGGDHPAGTYYYVVEYADPCDGKEMIRKKAFIQLIR